MSFVLKEDIYFELFLFVKKTSTKESFIFVKSKQKFKKLKIEN